VSEKPPFDPIRASFYLIAAVLAVQCTAAMLAVAACLYWGQAVIEGKWTCENINATLNQLLSGALAAALAFAAGFTRKDR
jgi:hypothetical protein